MTRSPPAHSLLGKRKNLSQKKNTGPDTILVSKVKLKPVSVVREAHDLNCNFPKQTSYIQVKNKQNYQKLFCHGFLMMCLWVSGWLK